MIEAAQTATLTRDLTLRIGGESGEGIVTTGEVLARIASYAGLEVYTLRTIPAEIKGGHVMFQMRAGREQVHSQGDHLDILLAFNQEAYDNHHDELRQGGILLFDSNEISPPPVAGEIQYPLPLTKLAKSIDFMRGKNIVAIGALVKIFGLPYDKAKVVIERQLGRRGADLLAKNLQALDLGYHYVEENIAKEAPYNLGVAHEVRGVDRRLVMSGNQALSIGALAAGCTFYAGYPITPASDIMEFLAAELPKMGGTLIQAEDEMAALGMAMGAAFTGARAMTATSGPGFDLMIELLGHASMTETPVVIVDVQRAGPSTGMPTKTSQGDLFLAVYGGHDDFPRIVVAPLNVEDCFYAAIDAFNLAEKYQTPVIILSEFLLSNRVETIPSFDMTRVRRMERVLWASNGNSDRSYKRYRITESGVSPMSLPGMVGGSYTAEGLEHDETGAPGYTPELHTTMMEKRFRKLLTAADEIREWPHAVWRYGHEEPEVGVVGWGSTAGPVREAIDRALAQGMKVAAFFPRFLSPMPEKELSEFVAPLRAVIVPELNYRGQLADVIQAKFCMRIHRLNKFTGEAFTAGEIYRYIAAVYSEWVVPANA
jgi:2-oxoglutarate ferredoxin oxidoreductase subunit alpha